MARPKNREEIFQLRAETERLLALGGNWRTASWRVEVEKSFLRLGYDGGRRHG